MMKIKFYVKTNVHGSDIEEVIEFNESEFEGMTEAEREAYVEKEFEEWVWNNVEAGSISVDDDNDDA